MYLTDHCHQLMIVGSLRRKDRSETRDIDLLCVPKFREIPIPGHLFGETHKVNRVVAWVESSANGLVEKTGGGDRQIKLDYRGLPVDIYMTTEDQFGRMVALKTGPANYAKKMAARWVSLGYHGVDGELIHESDPEDKPSFKTEREFFDFLMWTYVDPEKRQ